jgi:hypothetical protein
VEVSAHPARTENAKEFPANFAISMEVEAASAETVNADAPEKGQEQCPLNAAKAP